MKKRLGSIITVSALALAAVVTPAAYAATTANSQLTQQINAGVISTDIRDASNNILSNPTFAMGAVSRSATQQTSTGTFGDNTKRISVDNPGASTNGGAFTLALNAATPGDTWTAAGGKTYKYNDASAANGQLTVNPAAGTITPVTGGATGVSKGSSATFSGNGAITIMSADGTSAPFWNGYITGIGLSQTIPANQAAGAYTLNMVQTVTAL